MAGRVVPHPLSEEIRRRMQTTSQRHTGPERAVQQQLDSAGLRYETDTRAVPSLRSRPDILFPAERLAVFVDGCFWHACPEHGTLPKNNAGWWAAKLAANRRRDEEAGRILTETGWIVLRFWEHDDPLIAAENVLKAVSRRRTALAAYPATGGPTKQSKPGEVAAANAEDPASQPRE